MQTPFEIEMQNARANFKKFATWALNPDEIRRAINTIVTPGELFEIRILSGSKGKYNASGYFTDANTAAQALTNFKASSKYKQEQAVKTSVYITLNPVKMECYAREQHNKFVESTTATQDKEVLRYKWFFIDFDPERTSGISSTDAELQKALAKSDEVRKALNAAGWTNPLQAISGNGAHLLYRIDLPNTPDSETLISRALQALNEHFHDDSIKIDTVNCNPARICKLYGTIAQKGANTADRPHRPSFILFDEVGAVNPREKLEALAARCTEPEKITGKTKTKTSMTPAATNVTTTDQGKSIDFVEQFVTKYAIQVTSRHSKDGSEFFDLDHCIFDESHTGRDAAIIVSADGTIVYKCLHDSCKGKHWKDVRLHYEPDAYTKKAPETAGNEPQSFEAVQASTVEEDHTRFTWYPYLPAGDYSLLMAAGGTGKTIFCCGIAAAISSGSPLPLYYGSDDGYNISIGKTEPQNVLLISAEDRASMLRKRLAASGADLSRCFILDCMATNGLYFPKDAADSPRNATWNDILTKYKPEFVFIDPWHSFLDPTINPDRMNAVRQVVHNIAVLCKNHDCSMLLVSHVNKKAQGENANNAASGSADLVNAARSAMQVIFDSSEGGADRRIVVHTKSNYAATGRSVAFNITSDSGCEWDGFSEITRATLEEAARAGRKPQELLEVREIAEERRKELIEAITALSEVGEIVRVRYSKLTDEYGEGIYLGKQPKHALSSIYSDLMKRGIELKNFGKKIRDSKADGGATGKGFEIHCMRTPEQMTAALPK